MVLWIWPDHVDDPEVEKVRSALSSRGFEWTERIEENMSDPITLDTGYEELNPENIMLLDRYSIEEGKLLFCGMTEEQFDKQFKESL